MRKELQGNCHICGEFGKLSNEHVPPQKALNDYKQFVVTGSMRNLINDDLPWDLSKRSKKQYQNGIGYRTLCVKCNNITGHWYGSSFIDFTIQGSLETCGRKNKSRDIIKVNFIRIKPFEIIKQIMSLFCSVNSDSLSSKHPKLRKFILNRESRSFDLDEFRVYVYILKGSIARNLGVSGMFNAYTGENRLVSEVSAPPFSYFLEINPQKKDDNYCDISFFATDYYKNYTTDLRLPIPILESNTFLPAFHKSKEDIIKSYNKN